MCAVSNISGKKRSGNATMKTVKITDNVSLHYIEASKFKTTTLGIYLHRPLSDSEASKNSLLPMVLRRGSEKYPTLSDMERRLGDLCGAVLNTYTIKRGEDHVICLDISTISDKYNLSGDNILSSCADLLLDMLLCPKCENGAFCAEYVRGEKKNLSDMLDALVNDKQAYAQWRVYEIMCKGEHYGTHEYGTKADIEKITPESLYAHYKNVLSSSKIDIFVCGEADTDAFAKKLAADFKDISSGKCGYPATQKIYTVGDIKTVSDEFDTSQAKLSLGFRVDSDVSYPEMLVANSVWGSSPHSKLFNNVREKLSLAYYAFSRYDKYKNTVMAAMGIETKNYKKALDETLLQLENVKNGSFEASELAAAKAFLINQLQSQKDSQYAMIDYNMGALISGSDLTADELCRQIDTVDAGAVQKAAGALVLDTIYFLKGRE